jgi:hypothetical protein
MPQIKISSKEANTMFQSFIELKDNTINLYKLMVQKINRYKIPRKFEIPFFVQTNEGKKEVTYLTNDSVYLTCKKNQTEIISIREIPLEVLVNLNLRLGEKVTEYTNGKY